MQSDKNSSCGGKVNKRTEINNKLANTVLLRVVIPHNPKYAFSKHVVLLIHRYSALSKS